MKNNSVAERKLREIKERLLNAKRYRDKFEDSEKAIIQKIDECLEIIG